MLTAVIALSGGRRYTEQAAVDEIASIKKTSRRMLTESLLHCEKRTRILLLLPLLHSVGTMLSVGFPAQLELNREITDW